MAHRAILFVIVNLLCVDAKILPIPASTVDSDGLLITSICHNYKDCEVTTTSPSLSLACYYNVNKCNCYNTFDSIYHLGVVGDKCLMSKYGPSGTNHNNTFQIDCSDNFECINGRCQEKGSVGRQVKGVYEFSVPSCDACQFEDDLELEWDKLGNEFICHCKAVDIPDRPGTYWDLRNYAGQNNCSTGEHGPCGTKGRIEIGCHGDNMKCINGRCTSSSRLNPLSGRGESCGRNSNCVETLVCSADFQCIEANSVSAGERCRKDDECAAGLYCGFDVEYDPFNPSVCTRDDSET